MSHKSEEDQIRANIIVLTVLAFILFAGLIGAIAVFFAANHG